MKLPAEETPSGISMADLMGGAIQPGMKAQTEFDSTVSRYNQLIAFFVAVSLIIMVIDTESVYNFPDQTEYSFFLKTINNVVTLILILLTCMYWSFQMDLERRRYHLKYKLSITTSQCLTPMLFDILVLVIHPLDALGIVLPQAWTDLVGLAMLGRLVNITLRVVKDQSYIYGMRKDLLNAASNDSTMRNLQPSSFDSNLSIRYCNATASHYFIAGLSIPLILSVSYGMWITERRGQPEQFGTFGNSLWFTMVTMTTVGYGDRSPVTVQGRIVAMFGSLGGIVVVSLLIAVVTEVLTMDSNRTWAVGKANLDALKEKETVYACQYVQNAWLRFAFCKRTAKTPTEKRMFGGIDKKASAQPKMPLDREERIVAMAPYFAKEVAILTKLRSTRSLRQEAECANVSERDAMVEAIHAVAAKYVDVNKKMALAAQRISAMPDIGPGNPSTMRPMG